MAYENSTSDDGMDEADCWKKLKIACVLVLLVFDADSNALYISPF